MQRTICVAVATCILGVLAPEAQAQTYHYRSYGQPVKPQSNPAPKKQWAPAHGPEYAAAQRTAQITPQKPAPAVPSPDPVALERAALLQTLMTQGETEMTGLLKKISQNIPKMPDDKLGDSVAEMEKTVLDLQASAGKVVAGYAEYRRAVESYHLSVAQAPDAYRNAAELCRAKSVDPNMPQFLRQKYAQLSEDCLACVKLVKERHEVFDGTSKEIAATVENVKQTSAFLNDYLNFLKLYPGRDSSKARAEFTEELRLFIRNFKAFEKRFQEISDQLREKEAPKEVKLTSVR